MQIGRGKKGVLIGEYTGTHDKFEDGNAIIGYVEPACDNPQWILWFTAKGDAILHRERDEIGAILDKPLRVKH